MATFPNSPKLIKGGIVLLNPDTSAVQRIIALQYNSDRLAVPSRFKAWVPTVIARKGHDIPKLPQIPALVAA